MATDELTLLERVLFRIGSAESDEQLQNAVSKFLPPVLLKLSSQQDGVRKKVMELLVHINKRLKSRPLVQLPVESLLLQYQDPAASSFVTNFTIIYVKMGYPRLPVAKQAELVPCLLNALEGKPQSHQDSLLMLMMPVLGHVSVPADPRLRSSLLGLDERPHLSRLLSQFMLDLLLLPYGATPGTEQSQPQQQGAAAFPTPAGMSEAGFRRVTADTPLSPEQLEQTKLGVVKFLSSGLMPEPELLVHLVVAAADTRFSVANAADTHLKKMVGSLDWGSPSLLAPLYELYLGTPAVASKARPQDQRRRPASTRIRLKLLPFLSRARGPALIFPSCIQVFFESLYGTEFTNARLKAMALQFSMVVITGSSLARLTPVAGVFLSGLLKLISEEEAGLKALAYSAAGKLAQRVPSLVNKDLCLLQTFFNALSQEDQETRLSVREALLSMVEAFRPSVRPEGEAGADAAGRQVMMHALLCSQVESSEPSARFLAVRYACAVFPAAHVPSRYLLLLACGDTKEEVRAEARRGLYGAPGGVGGESADLPPFPEVVQHLAQRARHRLQSPGTRHQPSPTSSALPFNPQTHLAVLEYARLCLWSSARVGAAVDEAQPCPRAPLLRRYLLALRDASETLGQYVWLAEQLLGLWLGPAPLAALAEVVGSVPELLPPGFCPKMLPQLKGLFSSTKESVRPLAALLHGIVCAHSLSGREFEDSVTELIRGLDAKSVELQQGQLLAAAHGIERKLCGAEQGCQLASSPGYQLCVDTIVRLLDHQNAAVVATACTSLQLVARRAPVHPTTTTTTTTTTTASTESDGQLALVRRLQQLVADTKMSTKVREQASLALGSLCLCEAFPHSRLIVEGFLGLAKEERDVDVHLSAGEALVLCVQGGASVLRRDEWRQLEGDWAPPPGPDAGPAPGLADADLGWLLDQLVSLVPEPRPSSRQAACFWLLALLRHCPARPAVASRLDALQRAFMDLLADNSELVQDAASKGLALVYESSEEESRSRLVAELLEQLGSGRRQVARVSQDTKVFEEGALGQSPTGGGLSTYKELCSMASDLNQPELIYKFMHLANHNAIWNSKKGAGFGFSTLVSQSGQQLASHLPKIVPRLYRYRFDPTPAIQASMSSIWRALVPDTQSTVDSYHAEILAELVENMTFGGQWRVRYSCCAATSDFLRCGPNRSLHDSLPLLPRLWTQLFRVMDDVHPGVRSAATTATKDLAKLCVRCCDVGSGKPGEEVVRAVLPVLLESGICNTVPEVRAVSLQLVSQLVGAAGGLVRPHLASLMPALLEAAGELEPRALSYLSARLGAEQGVQEAVDEARAAAATSHHTTDTVAKCVQYVDAGTLPQLVPRLLELLKGSVALGTRVASAHLVVLLTYHLRLELQPYAGKLLSTLLAGLTDRNAAVRKHFATTIGHVSSVAKDSSVGKLLSKLRASYLDKDDESYRCACAYAMQSVIQRNPGVLKDHADIVIPLVFFATHAAKTPDGSSSSVELWEEVWQDAAPSAELALKTNLASVCELLASSLQSSSWTTKAQAGRTAGALADKVGPVLGEADVRRLVGALLAGLAGRTWSGKECLLHALQLFATGCRAVLRRDSCADLVTELLDALVQECRKRDPAYKRSALRTLGGVLAALDVDRFDQVYALVQDTLSQVESAWSTDGQPDQDLEGAVAARENRILLTEVAYETLGKAWPSYTSTQDKHREVLLRQCCAQLAGSTRPVQVAVVAALHSLVAKLALLEPAPAGTPPADGRALADTLEQLRQALQYALGVGKHVRLRKEALNVLFLLSKKLKDAGLMAELGALAASLQETLGEVGKDPSPEVKTRLSDIHQLFKL